jgi:hypothetical protein
VSDHTPDPSAGVPPVPPPPPAAGAYGAPTPPPSSYTPSSYPPAGYPAASPYASAPPASSYPPPEAAYPATYATQPAPYGYGVGTYAYPPAPKTNGLAVASMICSLVGAIFSITLILGPAAIAGVIMGHIAMKRLQSSGEGGRGMALTGVIVGWIGIGLFLLFGFLFVVLPILIAMGAIGAAYTYSA